MGEEDSLSPAEWIPGAITYLIATIITFKILTTEIKKRRLSTTKFTTKSLEYLSLICIIAAFMTNLSLSINEINGFCHFATFFGLLCQSMYAGFIGFYQLSRLYYCFSNANIRNNHVFNASIIDGIISIISIILLFCK